MGVALLILDWSNLSSLEVRAGGFRPTAAYLSHPIPGPIQVEELGCLDVEAEATVESSGLSQPLVPVSKTPAWAPWVGSGRLGLPLAHKAPSHQSSLGLGNAALFPCGS